MHQVSAHRLSSAALQRLLQALKISRAVVSLAIVPFPLAVQSGLNPVKTMPTGSAGHLKGGGLDLWFCKADYVSVDGSILARIGCFKFFVDQGEF